MKEKNGGKGSCLKAGIQAATGDIVIFQDADLEYDPADYQAMILPILDGRTEAVLGVRVGSGREMMSRKTFYYWVSWLGGELITGTTNLLYSNHAIEYEGCYKAFTKQALASITITARI